MNDKILYIVRGIPGSGKTTLANSLGSIVYSADDYFISDSGEYNFDYSKLGLAHQHCFNRTKGAMKKHFPRIFVANTFTTEKEIQPYIDLAKEMGYTFFSIIVENRNNTKNIHDVPEEIITKMLDRFNIKL